MKARMFNMECEIIIAIILIDAYLHRLWDYRHHAFYRDRII